VIIDGKMVMENRKILTLDEEEVLDQAREWGERIFTEAPKSSE